VTAVRSEKSKKNVEIHSHKSGNLNRILNIFEKYLKMVFIILYKLFNNNNILIYDFQNVNLDCKLLVLKWIYELLIHPDNACYLNIILLSQEMNNIVHSLVYVALKRNDILLFESIAQIFNVVLENSTFCQSKVIKIVLIYIN